MSYLLEKAVSLKNQGKYEIAINTLKDGLIDSNADAETKLLLVHLLILNENLQEAAYYLSDVKKINPNNASVGWNEARLNLKMQNVKTALEVARETNYLFPEDVEGIGILGACLRANNMFEESIVFLNKAIQLDPNYAEALINRALVRLHNEDEVGALKDLDNAFNINPHIKQIWDLLVKLKYQSGDFSACISLLLQMLKFDPSHQNSMKFIFEILSNIDDPQLSIKISKEILKIKPNDINVLVNMGTAFQKNGDLDDAISAYMNALKLKPELAQVHYFVGNTLRQQGKLDESIFHYEKAILLQPDYDDTYNNFGTVLHKQGKLDEALVNFQKAISINPSNFQAYNNMGLTLVDQVKMEDARNSFKKALAINQDHARAAWNLSGTATNIKEAENWLERCLSIDKSHLQAKLTLTALRYYQGDEAPFNALSASSLANNRYIRSFSWVFKLPNLPKLFFYKWDLFDFVVKNSVLNRPFYEFGVWRGSSFKYLIKAFKKGYGFDTFTGIPEDWHDETVGTYSSDGAIPKIHGGEFIVGEFQDTLIEFFSVSRPKASVINFDADLYSSTLCALRACQNVIDPSTILIFDEFLINENWEEDEYKALTEFCTENNFNYEVLAVSFFTKQVALRLTKI